MRKQGYKIIFILAEVPGVAKVTHSYFRRLPELDLKLRFCLVFPIKVDPLNLESQNQTKKICEVKPNAKALRHFKVEAVYKFDKSG